VDLASDARQAWVEFRSRPWVSAVAVVTLALGVAGATTMFTMLSAVGSVMVPPGVDAARIARVVWMRSEETGTRGPVTADEYAELKKGLSVFETVSAWTDQQMLLGGAGGPSVSVKRVSIDFFRTLGFKPSAGRLFTADDARGGSPRVAILREGARQRLGGLNPRSLVRLGGNDYAVVGILPDRCWYPGAGGPDFWLPLEMSREGVPAAREVWMTVRLRSSDRRSLELARSQVAAAGTRLAQASPVAADRSRRLVLITLQADVGTRVGFGLLGLLGPAIIVLLITCGNVANLLLARAARREREMAVRAALGASRFRLIRERLAESAWLGGLGGALGVALAVAGVALLRLWVASFEESHSAADTIQLSGTALLFAVGVTIAIPLVFGLVPALVASKPNLTQSLHSAPGSRRPRRGPYGGRDVLVIVEIGLAIVLVVCAVMFSRFFAALNNIDWGFDASKVVAVGLSFGHGPSAGAADARRLADIVDAVRQVPGVRAAATGGLPGLSMERDRQPIEFDGCAAATGRVGAVAISVGPQYFSTLGLPVRRGRAISEMDTAGSAPVAVISERHGARCWPGQDPIGHRIRRGQGADARWLTVVGVVPDTMVTRALADGPQAIYIPSAQSGSSTGNAAGRPVEDVPNGFFVRADGDTRALVERIRATVRRVDPTQPLDDIERLDERWHRRFGGAPLIVGILGGFGAFALALGALGVFSVTSYMVAERTREFGIRIALGASRREVLQLVLKQAAIIVGIGTAVSFAGTLAVTRLGFREMADLAITDPILWASVCFLLVAVAVGASIVPAQRAMRVEPIVALRAE